VYTGAGKSAISEWLQRQSINNTVDTCSWREFEGGLTQSLHKAGHNALNWLEI